MGRLVNIGCQKELCTTQRKLRQRSELKIKNITVQSQNRISVRMRDSVLLFVLFISFFSFFWPTRASKMSQPYIG
jgi:hypothetical protein